MEQLKLVRPSNVHKAEYESMMDEWENYGGRLNPGALRRYRQSGKKTYLTKNGWDGLKRTGKLDWICIS